MEKDIKKVDSSTEKSFIKRRIEIMGKRKFYLILFYIFLLAILLIVATYAWFSTALNVQIRNFNVVAARNSGLTISYDAINYGAYLDINEDTIINNLDELYPTHTNRWASHGLVPVSTIGLSSNLNNRFSIYHSQGVFYRNYDLENPMIYADKTKEEKPSKSSYFVAFDIFLKNDSGSPIADNLFLTEQTFARFNGEYGEEMNSLLNTTRFGFVKMGSVSHDTDPTVIQQMGCVGTCEQVIYEPNHDLHTDLSIENALDYGINLVDGQGFPTYAMIKDGGPIALKNAVSGSVLLDNNYFALQDTITNNELNTPIMRIPDGITKVRVYVWLEAQDIDSIETNSTGADIELSIDFVKDTYGYDSFN